MNTNPLPIPPGSTDHPLEVLQTPFCGDLRSKKYYMNDAIMTDAEEYEDASGHIWCYHTQMALGPDGQRAAPEYCGPTRKCYRSALAPAAPYVPPPRKVEPEVVKIKTQNTENPEV